MPLISTWSANWHRIFFIFIRLYWRVVHKWKRPHFKNYKMDTPNDFTSSSMSFKTQLHPNLLPLLLRVSCHSRARKSNSSSILTFQKHEPRIFLKFSHPYHSLFGTKTPSNFNLCYSFLPCGLFLWQIQTTQEIGSSSVLKFCNSPSPSIPSPNIFPLLLLLFSFPAISRSRFLSFWVDSYQLLFSPDTFLPLQAVTTEYLDCERVMRAAHSRFFAASPITSCTYCIFFSFDVRFFTHIFWCEAPVFYAKLPPLLRMHFKRSFLVGCDWFNDLWSIKYSHFGPSDNLY